VIQKIKNSLKKRNVKVFLVFLICSTSAWFISNLSESYISNTIFELQYINAKDDLMLVNSSQDKIKVKLEAVGFQFLRFGFKKRTVPIDLSKVFKKGRQYYLSTRDYREQIEKTLPNSMRLIDIANDTLFFDFQEVISKEIPVKPQIKITLAKNYLLDGKLDISPSIVVLKGPRNEVDTISSVKTYGIDLTNLTTDFSQKTSLVIPDGLRYAKFSETWVTVGGKVSRFSEKIISVKIKALNFPSGTTITMFPSEVDILCKGSIVNLKDLVSSDFEVVADFEEIKSNYSKKIVLRIRKIPEFLSSAVLQESEAEYIVKRE